MAKKDTNRSIRPLFDRVLVEEIKGNQERKLDSGIYLPDSVKEDRGAKKGVVSAIGPGKRVDGELQPPCVAVGDIVLFSWGDEIVVDGNEYHLVSESNILAVIQ